MRVLRQQQTFLLAKPTVQINAVHLSAEIGIEVNGETTFTLAGQFFFLDEGKGPRIPKPHQLLNPPGNCQDRPIRFSCRCAGRER